MRALREAFQFVNGCAAHSSGQALMSEGQICSHSRSFTKKAGEHSRKSVVKLVSRNRLLNILELLRYVRMSRCGPTWQRVLAPVSDLEWVDQQGVLAPFVDLVDGFLESVQPFVGEVVHVLSAWSCRAGRLRACVTAIRRRAQVPW